MKFINNLILKYTKFLERRKIIAQEKKIYSEEKWKKHCLNYYGVYHNADGLSRKEILEVFWKILKNAGYDISHFNSNTSVREPAKQMCDWNDLGGAEFIYELDKIFGFSKKDITDKEYEQIKTFGEAADLLIKKAKEKKLKQQETFLVIQ